MTGFRAVIMLVVIAALMLTFLPMLAITGLGDLNASNGYVPPTTAAPSGGGGAATSTTTPPPGGNGVTITATTLAFDKTKITVPAGKVSITFDNKDTGVPHNLNVFDGSSNSAKSLGQTDIKAGPNTQTLNVTLKAGTYYFQCDVHPSQMHGTITAQ